MRVRTKVGSTGALLLVLAGLSGVSVTAVGDSAGGDVAYASRFRAHVGFQHGDEFVLGTYSDQEAYPDWAWGLPLSASEAQSMKDRTRIRDLEQPTVEYAYRDPDFGGMWFDQSAGGKAYFRFTTDLASHQEDLAERLPEGASFEVVSADYSWAALSATRDQIAEELPVLDEAGLKVVQVAAIAKFNRVVVSVEVDEEAAESYLRSRYGPIVTTTVESALADDACNNRYDCRDPLKGGLEIRPVGHGTDAKCSSAFLAKKPNGVWLLVTAGHCVELYDAAQRWKHDGLQFGTDQGDTLPAKTAGVIASADVGWIAVDGDEDKTPANQFYGTSNTDIKSYTAMATNAYQQEGDIVCRSAAVTGYKCSPIFTAASGTNKPNGEGWDIRHTWVMQEDANLGDSGGIYVTYKYNLQIDDYEYRVAGVHVHSTTGYDEFCNTCKAWYSTAEDYEALSGHSVCLSVNC